MLKCIQLFKSNHFVGYKLRFDLLIQKQFKLIEVLVIIVRYIYHYKNPIDSGKQKKIYTILPLKCIIINIVTTVYFTNVRSYLGI